MLAVAARGDADATVVRCHLSPEFFGVSCDPQTIPRKVEPHPLILRIRRLSCALQVIISLLLKFIHFNPWNDWNRLPQGHGSFPP